MAAPFINDNASYLTITISGFIPLYNKLDGTKSVRFSAVHNLLERFTYITFAGNVLYSRILISEMQHSTA